MTAWIVPLRDYDVAPREGNKNMSDAGAECELLAKATSGDRAALHKLLLVHYQPLTVHIAKRIPRHIQGAINAEDIVQQTFLQVMRHIGQFTPRTNQSFYAWLKKIAENGLKDTIRHFTREKRDDERGQVHKRALPDESSVTDLVEMLSAGSHSPSRSAARHEAVAAVQQAIDALPEDYRQAVDLRLLAGKSLTETATIMHRSPRAVQGLVDRAKKKMRAALGCLSLYE